MVSLRNILASALALSSSGGLGVVAETEETSLAPRGKSDIAKQILEFVGIMTEDTVYTYDWKKYRQFCDLYIETKNGGGCYVTVECQNGGKKFYNENHGKWPECRVGGWNNFEDDRIGKFAIHFRTRDGGLDGQGLTEPLIRMQEVSNWRDWDVAAMSLKTSKAWRCEKGITPLRCDQGPFTCNWVTTGNANPEDGRMRRWRCGVPVKGEKVLEKMEWPMLTYPK